MLLLTLLHLPPFLLLLNLLRLTSATPITPNQTPSTPLLAKRAFDDYGVTNCLAAYGSQYWLPDCNNALQMMRNHFSDMPSMSRFPAAFSRLSENRRFLLPKLFRTSTCTLLVDTEDVKLVVRSDWPTRIKVAEDIVQRCVVGSNLGGDCHTGDGFITLVVNERELDRDMRDTFNLCTSRVAREGDVVARSRCTKMYLHHQPTAVPARPAERPAERPANGATE